jgi:hypothetical protein
MDRAMLNLYAPPSAGPATPVAPRRAAAVALAWTEIIAGLALGSRGCVICLALGGSIAHLAAMMVFVVAFVGLVLPGVVLLEVRHPARWLAQPIPLALVVMLFV